ncbi:complexed with cef1p [Claviceps purpurea]|nr:complexed with cef1p [Claviceps purpurea]KAG6159233.1 complexed with cef1p [Claviceps purpurea]KAG6320421.1 complexed with cef1p [Claviceps purpurea]KAG6320990.1 complexed with cef1p [Claviceps purpurea]
MTTAHRPTFDPARGKEALRGPAYHQRLLPAYTQLKFRQAGQGGDADEYPTRDLAAELLAAEAVHFSKIKGSHSLPLLQDADADDEARATAAPTTTTSNHPQKKRPSSRGSASSSTSQEDYDAKRRRILEESRAVDADDSDDASDNDSSSSDSEDDEEAELARELERVRREREEKKKKEEAERAKAEDEARERDIALGNPLLNKPDFTMKRRWDDDVVFKNQARGTEEKGKKKEFVNDLLRSDFHRRFMGKYVR